MKARVKATGALLIVRPYDGNDFDWICDMDGETGSLWKTEELDFIDDYEPDYWEKLKHQYAGMAMQSYVNNDKYLRELREICKEAQEMRDYIADLSIALATALVNKLKEEEK